jgi:cytochrome c553
MAMSLAIPRVLAAIAALAAGLALWPMDAIAQPAALPDQALRPLYANSADIAEGKDLADASCAKCHGENGVSATKGVPNLAGQRPSYVYLELKAYQRGDRAASGETHGAKLLKAFTDEALANVAAYYASLDPASPPGGSQPSFDDPVAAGKGAAAPCAKCHGESGISHKEGVPSLIGLHPKYLFETMQAYKSGERPVDAKSEEMKKALDSLSDKDLQSIALYYAVQNENPTRAQTPNPGGAPVSKDALAACAKCHGEAGVSTSKVNPSLAGQDAGYMLSALRAYRDRTRDDDAMSPKAQKLDDAEMKDFAAYYAGLDPKPVDIQRPLTPVEWARKCDRCHGVNGNSTRPEVPALAAQRQDYLETVLRSYQSGARKSPEMGAMSSILTEDEMKGIAAHYAYQKPRAAVFVVVPGK